MKNANPVSWCLSWLPTLFLALLLGGCGRSESAAPPVPKTVADYFTVKLDGHPVQMQLAVLGPEMERGLMNRRTMGRDEGMLFIFLRPQRMSFWMRNTRLPLDIGFFSPAGELREIYQMYPLDETPLASHADRLQFALEMNQGWFKANQVKPGAQLDLKALVAALRERDFDPEKFGLR